MNANKREKDGSMSQVPCSLVLKDYNWYRNFADNFDRLREDYKWTKTVRSGGTVCFSISCIVLSSMLTFMHKEKKMEQLNQQRFSQKCV